MNRCIGNYIYACIKELTTIAHICVHIYMYMDKYVCMHAFALALTYAKNQLPFFFLFC